MFKPSPKGLNPPVPLKSMPAKPPVIGGPTIPGHNVVPDGLVLRQGTPKVSIGVALASE